MVTIAFYLIFFSLSYLIQFSLFLLYLFFNPTTCSTNLYNHQILQTHSESRSQTHQTHINNQAQIIEEEEE